RVGLDVFGHFLEERRGRTPAPRTRRDLWREAADAERLQDLLRDHDFFRAIAVRLRRERDANCVAEAAQQQRSESGGAGHDAFCAHTCFGESEVKSVVTA